MTTFKGESCTHFRWNAWNSSKTLKKMRFEEELGSSKQYHRSYTERRTCKFISVTHPPATWSDHNNERHNQ